MIKFSDFSKKEKMNFLLQAMGFYVFSCSQGRYFGLCYIVEEVAKSNGISINYAHEFMGENIWNPAFAGVIDKNQDEFWWSLTDYQSRILFLSRLIYNIKMTN